MYNSQLEVPRKNLSCLPRRDSNLEPLHVKQEKIRYVHDCALHWLHCQGNTFIFNAYIIYIYIYIYIYKIYSRYNISDTQED